MAATAVPLGMAEQALSVATGGMASGLRRATFAPHRGSRFGFDDGTAVHVAVLRKVGDVRTAPTGHDRKFVLLFEVDGAPPAGTYRLRHPRMGELDLFVTPVGGKAGMYEAVVDAA